MIRQDSKQAPIIINVISFMPGMYIYVHGKTMFLDYVILQVFRDLKYILEYMQHDNISLIFPCPSQL